MLLFLPASIFLGENQNKQIKNNHTDFQGKTGSRRVVEATL